MCAIFLRKNGKYLSLVALLKDNPYKKVKKLGVMSILDKKGFGLNHIFL